MRPRRRTAIQAAFTVLIGAAGLALAQQPAPTPAPPTASTPAPAPSASVPPAKGTVEDVQGKVKAEPDAGKKPDEGSKPDEATKPADVPRKPAAATGSPQRFEPTERVRPDFDVAFPVDI